GRRAGISSFGMSGTNAHLVVEDAPAPRPRPPAPPERPLHLLALSARTEPALRALAAGYARYLASADSTPLGDIAATAANGRSAFEHRLALWGASHAQWREALEAFAQGGRARCAVAGQAPRGPRRRVAFLFTGQGAQYRGMG